MDSRTKAILLKIERLAKLEHTLPARLLQPMYELNRQLQQQGQALFETYSDDDIWFDVAGYESGTSLRFFDRSGYQLFAAKGCVMEQSDEYAATSVAALRACILGAVEAWLPVDASKPRKTEPASDKSSLTLPEVARRLRVRRERATQLIDAGELLAHDVSPAGEKPTLRVSVSDLEAFINSRAVNDAEDMEPIPPRKSKPLNRSDYFS